MKFVILNIVFAMALCIVGIGKAFAADPTSGQFLFQQKNAGAGFSNFGVTSENSKAFGLDGSGVPTMLAVGSGTVTSVSLTLPSAIFDVAGSPVTTSGGFTVSFDNQSANTVFAGPTTGGAAAPAFRALVAGDIPDLSSTYIPMAGTTSFGRGLLDDPNASAARVNLELGTVATLNTGTGDGDVPVLGGGGSLSVGTVSAGSITANGGGFFFENGGFTAQIAPLSGLTNNRVWDIPDRDGTFVFATGAQTLTGKTIQSPSFTGTASWVDNTRQTFNPGNTNAGLNVGANASDPSSLTNGDLWYNSGTNALMARIGGTTVEWIKAGSPPAIGGDVPAKGTFTEVQVTAGGATIRSGIGDPENAVDGNIGDLYLRMDGAAGTTLYVKEADSGVNTGWAPK